MNKKYLTALELVFFAFAMFLFIPELKSDPSPYTYVRPTAIVLVAITISRALAYRNGRGLVPCLLEIAIVVAVFIGQRMTLNVAMGHGL